MFCDGESPHLSITDFVNLRSFLYLREALNLKYLKIENQRTRLNGMANDVYRIGPIMIRRHWEYRGLYAEPASPGFWIDTYSKHSGSDMVSLKLHLAHTLSRFSSHPPSGCSPELLQEAAAQFRPTASWQSVFDDLVSRLGIDVSEPKIPQPASFRGWSQVAWVSASSPPFGGSIEEGDSSAWPDFRPDRVPFIGRPRTKFEIRDAMGRVQQIIGSWPTAGAPLLLSFTLWQNDRDPLHQQWKFSRSAIKACPYGLSNALVSKDATIVIDDDLLTVDHENKRMIEHHASAPPLVFLAWPRRLDGATPADTDWTQLKGRKVLVAVGGDRASLVHALELNDELLNAGVGSIEFVLPNGFMDGNNSITVDYEGGNLRGVHKDAVGLAMTAKQVFGISPKIEQMTASATVWKIGDGSSLSEADLLITPWLQRGTINLLYSDAGVGKSWFALLTVYALATGGKLLNKFQARRKLRCLYLAGEMGDRICRRIEDIHAAMPNCDAADNIEVYPRPGQNVEKLNLERAESWEALDALIDKVDVVVIDHLTAFTIGNNSSDSWSQLHAHLRRYAQQGKTILLVHHAGKDGHQRGTSKLDDDIDMKIHIAKLGASENGVRVTFEKHRDDETLGKAMQPFVYYWDQDPAGRLRWQAIDTEPSETKAWVKLSEANDARVHSVNEASILDNFEGKKADIIRCLAMARLKGKPGLRRPEIDCQIAVSPTTTRSLINDLVVKGVVIVEGEGKATRYALSDEIRKSVISE